MFSKLRKGNLLTFSLISKTDDNMTPLKEFDYCKLLKVFVRKYKEECVRRIETR